MYSEGHKHVVDVKLDSLTTVMFLNRILLLQGLLIAYFDPGSESSIPVQSTVYTLPLINLWNDSM